MGVIDGKGKLLYKNKDLYEGMFVQGRREGKGKLVSFKTKVSYDGGWIRGKRHGIGLLTDAKGKKLKMLFDMGNKVEL